LVDLSLSSVSNATGNFLTISGGVVHQRTPSETRSDVGAQEQLNGTGFVKASGTTISYDNSTYQVTSEKGQPNGYASLDGNGKVPLVQINDALIGNVNFQGLWNAATNTPTLANPPASDTKGHYYIVSTAGTFAGISFEVGDWIISDGTAWGKVDNTDAVSSVFGRTGNVTAANGDYTTAQVTESGNLYYTDGRARGALSFVAGSGAYDSSTGVITIPTNNNQITNGAGYITSAALSGYVQGSGSAGQVAYWSTGSAITGESNLFWDSTNDRLGIGTNTPATTLEVNGVGLFSGASLAGNTKNGVYIYDTVIASLAGGNSRSLQIQAQTLSIFTGTTYTEKVKVFENGNVVISTSPADSSFKLDVNGTGRFSGNAFFNSKVLINSTDTTKTPLLLNAEGNYSSSGNMTTGFAITNTSFGRALNMGVFESGAYGWIQAAYINNSDTTFALALQPRGGNLLVGTTDNNGARLQVSGAATFSSSVTATQMLINTTASNFTPFLLNSNGSFTASGNITTGLAITNTTAGRSINIGVFDAGAYAYIQSAYVASAQTTFALSLNPNGGNVLIGTTTDAGAPFRLQVARTGGSNYLNVITDNNAGYDCAMLFSDGTNQVYAGMMRGSTGLTGAYTIWTGGSARLNVTSGGNVMIGTGSANSKLQVAGSFATPHTTKSANYTLDATDYTVGFDCASNRTANLPDATTCAGRIYVIYQYNTNIGLRYVTIDGDGSQTINGLTTVNLQYQDDFSSVMIQSNGSNWVVIASALYAAPV
jgi:hypothetical protein